MPLREGRPGKALPSTSTSTTTATSDPLAACLDANGTYICTAFNPRCYIIQKNVVYAFGWPVRNDIRLLDRPEGYRHEINAANTRLSRFPERKHPIIPPHVHVGSIKGNRFLRF
ncbi:hypothetical protein Trydic_g15097 [Trypoxylus dichotomus]